MNAKEKQLLIQMQNELQKERQCCDMLADALIQGGLDRSFEALTFHELLRNGVQYPGAKLSRPKRSLNHPTMGYYIAGADQTPFDQDEEQ
jgi:hypothetical protein